jgi:hypothetical protein
MRLAGDAFQERGGEPRFADAGFARHQHHLALAGLCPGPAPQQKFEFLFPPDECGQSGRVKDVKPALDGTRAQRRPGPHAGHINLRSSLERGKLGPRVQTSVSRSSCFR